MRFAILCCLVLPAHALLSPLGTRVRPPLARLGLGRTISALEPAVEAVPEDAEGAARPMRGTDAGAIIAGTAIGGGFLALPSVTAPIGYVPSVVGLVGVWLFLVTGAVALTEAAGHVLTEDDGGEAASLGDSGITVASVTRRAFGPTWSLVSSALFVLQMMAVVTAQVVKAGEIASTLAAVPYAVGCVLPAVFAGVFTFASRPWVVERANTGLTAMMLAGFAALVATTLRLSSDFPGTSARLLGGTLTTAAAGDWAALLPRLSAPTSWAVPVFMNLLAFGQCIPLIVEGVVVRAAAAAGDAPALTLNATGPTSPTGPLDASALDDARRAEVAGDLAAKPLTVSEKVAAALAAGPRTLLPRNPLLNANGAAPYRELVVPSAWRREGWVAWERQPNLEEEEEVVRERALSRAAALRKARKAILLGSLVPLLLSVVWAAVSSQLVGGLAVAGGSDPVIGLLTGSAASIAMPVGLLAVGAIGTTLLGSFLAMGHFAAETLCIGFGVCTPAGLLAARVATVLLPTLCALAGPGLYLPLLAFAGAFPTTILYGLAPPVAALVLRKRARRLPGVPRLRLLPGGALIPAALALSAAAMLCASTGLAAVQAAGWLGELPLGLPPLLRAAAGGA